MNAKLTAQKTVFTIGKIIWALVCYTLALLLAAVSGYFTVVFYTEGNRDNDLIALGAMAIALEVIKLIFSIGYPFMKYRDKGNEKKVLLTIKISFVLSVMASMYYLMIGKDILRSPASKSVELIYEYIPYIDIIPIKLTQFLATASLTLLIEFFIVFLPIVATIMFKEKDYQRKEYKLTNLDKLKEVFIKIPDRLIDKIYKKAVGEADDNILVKEIENNKQDVKLLNIDNYKKNETSKVALKYNNTQEYKNEKPVMKSENPGVFLQNNTGNTSAESIENTDVLDNEETPDIIQKKASDNIIPENKNNLVEKEKSNDSFFLKESKFKIFKNEDERQMLRTIYKLADGDKCPSVKTLLDSTNINRNTIYGLKKEFEDMKILRSMERETKILCNYKTALSKLKSRIFEDFTQGTN